MTHEEEINELKKEIEILELKKKIAYLERSLSYSQYPTTTITPDTNITSTPGWGGFTNAVPCHQKGYHLYN